MSTTTRIGRLGVLAVGLGLGAAVVITPGIATPAMPDVDVSMDGVALSAFDIDININGVDVFHSGSTATATSGTGDMAIAFGPNSDAVAEGGFGDFASADSTGSSGATAIAGDPFATAGYNFDIASASGNNSTADAGDPFGGSPNTSSFDFASAAGGNGVGAGSTALAGDNGNGDSATAVGQNVEAAAGVSNSAAHPANFDSASALGNLSAPTGSPIEVLAGGGLSGLGGSNDVAFVDDPFGTVGSDAVAGLGHNFDLAGAFGDNLGAIFSTGADFVFHLAPFF